MEDLCSMMDTLSIAEIDSRVGEYVRAGDGYGNKLKHTFTLLSLLQHTLQSLKSVDSKDFISQVRDRINEVDCESSAVSQVFHVHLLQNNDIADVLGGWSDRDVAQIRKDVEQSLLKYDGLIKGLVRLRESLPLEKQMEAERK